MSPAVPISPIVQRRVGRVAHRVEASRIRIPPQVVNIPRDVGYQCPRRKIMSAFLHISSWCCFSDISPSPSAHAALITLRVEASSPQRWAGPDWHGRADAASARAIFGPAEPMECHCEIHFAPGRVGIRTSRRSASAVIYFIPPNCTVCRCKAQLGIRQIIIYGSSR